METVYRGLSLASGSLATAVLSANNRGMASAQGGNHRNRNRAHWPL